MRFFLGWDESRAFFAAHIADEKDTIWGHLITVPVGESLSARITHHRGEPTLDTSSMGTSFGLGSVHLGQHAG